MRPPDCERFGQKRTLALQKAMSALPPKADMCGALAHVCFGPEADRDQRKLMTTLGPSFVPNPGLFSRPFSRTRVLGGPCRFSRTRQEQHRFVYSANPW